MVIFRIFPCIVLSLVILYAGCSGEAAKSAGTKDPAEKNKAEEQKSDALPPKGTNTEKEDSSEPGRSKDKKGGKDVVSKWMDQRRSDETKVKLKSVELACKMFMLNVGSNPKAVEDLYRLPEGVTQQQWKGPFLDIKDPESGIQDSWGNPIWIEKLGAKIVAKSAGPNGKKGDDDDLNN